MRIFSFLIALLLATAGWAAQPGPAGPVIGGCPVFPPNNIWNVRVDRLPVDPNSTAYINEIGPNAWLHPDFGSGTWHGVSTGIPYVVVPGTQPKVPVIFGSPSESDPGPYPIPPDAPIEGGARSKGDRHVLVLDRDRCMLYELSATYPQPDGSWRALCGAIFDLRSHKLRPAGWTSADGAGLPMLPGLVRYEEVAAGEIQHAIRLTVPRTRGSYIWPARHRASTRVGNQYPPMGQRFRLRAGYDISGFSRQAQVILLALKRYGMLVADNGSAWFITGAPDPGWNNEQLAELKRVRGADLEAVDSSSLMLDRDSGQARPVAYHPAAVNGASYRPGPVAPGEIVSIFGAGIGPNPGVVGRPNESGFFELRLAGTKLLFDAVAAPGLVAGVLQVNVRVPAGVQRVSGRRGGAEAARTQE